MGGEDLELVPGLSSVSVAEKSSSLLEATHTHTHTQKCPGKVIKGEEVIGNFSI